MLKLALAQLKAQRGRYTAMIMAIIVGIAFFTASLAGVTSSQATLNNSLGALYTKSTVLAASKGSEMADLDTAFDDSFLQQVRATPDVEAAYLLRRTHAFVTPDGKAQRLVSAVSMAKNPEQRPFTITSGEAPTQNNEIVIDEASADKYGIKVGDTLKTELFSLAGEEAGHVLTVTGLFTTLNTPEMAGTVQAFMPESFLADYASVDSLVIATDPSNAAQVAGAVENLLSAEQQNEIGVSTVEDHITEQTSSGGDFLPIVLVLSIFSLIALAVMTLVINNTFSVIVAQRTRELGLLRIVGSTKAQVFRMVIGEAIVVGFLASVVGVILGIVLLAGALSLAATIWDIEIISFAVDANAFIWPPILGTLATVMAAWRPARNATKVEPVQALAPELMESTSAKVATPRIILGLLLALAGSALLYFFVFVSPSILPAMFGGLVSFVGLLILTPVFIPPLVSLVGRALKPFGVPGVQARLNAARHPRRSATTAAALLIGTTLIMMMITGAESMKRAVEDELNTAMPLGAMVNVYGSNHPDDPAELLAQASPLVQKYTEKLIPVHQVSTSEESIFVSDPAALNEASRVEIDAPNPGELMTSAYEAGTERSIDGKEFTTVNNPFGFSLEPVANAADFPAADQELTLYLVKQSGQLGAGDLEDYRDQLAEALGVEPAAVTGSVFERAMFEQIINMVLSIVNAMLAVALIIAFIGVANTLTLSTIERQRENGLLRAVGLTKSGLRSMLTLEALIISTVAAVVGSGLGVIYGWFGANVILVDGKIVLFIPWVPVAVIIGVSLLCAMLAATIPASRALKLQPVQALTE